MATKYKKKSFKKSYFFLNGPAFTPVLMAWPLVEGFFVVVVAASLNKDKKSF